MLDWEKMCKYINDYIGSTKYILGKSCNIEHMLRAYYMEVRYCYNVE